MAAVTKQHMARPPDAISVRNRLARFKARHAPAHLVVDAGSGVVLFLDGPVAPYLAPSSGVASLLLFSLLEDTLHDPVREALCQAAATGQATARHVPMPQDATHATMLAILVEPLHPADHAEDSPADAGLFVIAFHPLPGGPLPVGPVIRIEETVRDEGGRQEQQATIDELRYLNAELVAGNDRLVRLNEDVSTLLDSILLATMFLDRALRIRSFTSNMMDLFSLRRPDIGRPITDLNSRLDYAELEQDVRQVLASLQLVEREVQELGGSHRVFLMRMQPHRTAEGEPDGVVLTFVDITARKHAEDRAWFLARHDPLTGLPNRAMFHGMLERDGAAADQARGDQARAGIGLLYIDLDRFKCVNDTFGHRVGDRLLQLVAARLRGCVAGPAIVFRQGGDEFAIVRPGTPRPGELEALANAVLATIGAPYEIDGHVVQIGVSIGIASCVDAEPEADRLTRAADLALYDAKAQGRGTYSVFRPPMEVEWQRRRGLELDLREAVALGQLALVYQPIVRVADRAIVGAEALVRWHHPRHGTLPPASFIPIAEETGLIASIGVWVLQTACSDAARWAEPIWLSVNLSSVQFASLDLVDTVLDVLATTGFPPRRLALEVTETMLLQDNVRTQTVLAALRDAGVSLAMDDFGTGYSSLSYIRDFAVQKIKIDQAFIRTIDSQHASSVIVRAILTIGSGLDIGICAEGVETESQLAVLQEWGVQEVQGFLLYRPMAPERLAGLLRAPVGVSG